MEPLNEPTVASKLFSEGRRSYCIVSSCRSTSIELTTSVRGERGTYVVSSFERPLPMYLQAGANKLLLQYLCILSILKTALYGLGGRDVPSVSVADELF